ncbi:MAG: hypothetical protein OXG97_16380 [Candidatus Poribacteria bacterium]|nr:hypothetical protein [Candidatus Poribacteria bacterium]
MNYVADVIGNVSLIKGVCLKMSGFANDLPDLLNVSLIKSV